MDARLERQLREALEKHVGPPLSDGEWETFKRIQLESTQIERSRGETANRRWSGGAKAALLAAFIAAALAGAGLLAELGFMFSSDIKIPLGIFVCVIAVVFVGVWLKSVIWAFDLGWLLASLVVGLPLLVPFVAAGGVLLSKDRAYVASTQNLAARSSLLPEDWRPGSSLPARYWLGSAGLR